MDKMMNIRLLLSAVLLVLGILYWAAGNSFIKVQNQENNSFESIYALTGNEEQTVNILKCADKKTVQCAINEECSAELKSSDYHQECLNDWIDSELEAFVAK